ncbi:VapE domain-containing protein [Chryseobacterium sp. T1]
MKTSIFQNFNEVTDTQPITKVLESIRTGLYKNQIVYLRKSLADDKKEAAERIKKSLPAFTPSATFKGGRKLDFLQEYNKLICLDIDKLEKVKLAEVKSKAIQDEYVYAAFISPSGNGLKLFIKVETDQEEHKETFLLLQRYFEELLAVEIDKSGKDITRLCFVSFDSDLYLNENSTIFSTNEKSHQPSTDTHQQNTKNQTQKTINYDVIYEHCVRFTEKKEQFVEGNRNNFIYQLANNLNRKGIPETMALGYILADYNYDQKEILDTVKSAYNNTSDFNTDEFKLKNSRAIDVRKINGTLSGAEVEEDEEKPSFIDKLETFLNHRYNFRYNKVLGKLEFKTIKATKWKPMTDFSENSILREILKAKVKCSINSLRNLLHSDYCEMFDPFEVYFENLPKNEDETDYIQQLADTVTTTKQDLWRTCFKKWFVAMVACVLDEKQINQTVIVFSGKQGLGKTTWMEKLMPTQLKEYIFSGTINPNNKDTLIHLAECMLINLDELENLNRSEIGSLKEIITKTHIRMRKAYGHNNENMPRRASFAGSVNTSQFLNDTTGSRRFLCFEVEHIEYTHNIDINKVYAQALQLKEEGYRHWFNQEEIKEINANNEQYQLRSPEEELLLTWFTPAEKENAQYFFNTTQIAQILATRANINISDATVRKLGMALKKHNFKKIVKNKIYVYPITLHEYEDVDKDNKQFETPKTEALEPQKIPFRFDN